MSIDEENETVGADEVEARLERLEAAGREARWWRRVALALVAVGFCAPVAVDALGPVPSTFSNGDVISASAMNENFAHLQNAITAVEGKVPAETCAADQIPRFDGTSWVCSDDHTLAAGDTNLAVADGTVSLEASIDVSNIQVQSMDLNSGFRWNNSASNGTTEMSVFSHTSCDATRRGRFILQEHEDIGNSTDLGDALCYCQRYLNRTPDPDVESYRWVCVYPQSDGD